MNRTVSNWTAFIAGSLTILAAAFVAYRVANYAWAQVVDYRSPYTDARLSETTLTMPPVDPAAEATTAVVTRPRVVFVIIDGLREDVSRRMPTLNTLRDRGYDAVVTVNPTSLSFPSWTTLVSGAPPRISGVTTNWYEGKVKPETLFDVAVRSGAEYAVAAPSDFQELYDVKRSPNVLLRDWAHEYMTGEMVDDAISLAQESSATLVVLHSPDIDNAGHYEGGGASKAYLDTALKVDRDLGRLVTALERQPTVFVVAADHGHIDTGGHGGWEEAVVRVPAIFAGPGVVIGRGEGNQDQVAPTVAMIAGLPAPRGATGEPLEVLRSTSDLDRFDLQRIGAYDGYTAIVTGQAANRDSAAPTRARAEFEAATEERLGKERAARLPASLALALAAVALLALIGVLSWRALVAALSGTLGYYLVYSGLFFLLHGYRWSLSAFNSEDYLKAFFNGRMLEAVIAGVIGVFVAGDVYLMLRGAEAKRPRGEYLPGWLALGTATALAIQATLVVQVAWYVWRHGLEVTWLLPDFRWAFKADLDLIQVTALGALALLGPLATWIVGRFHPFPKGAEPEEGSGR